MNKFVPKTIPFKHQTEVTDLSWNKEFYALLMEMGTGKTKVVIDTIGMLFLDGKIDGALIIAPKGCYLNWTRNEIPIHMTESLDYRMAAWETSNTGKAHDRMEPVMGKAGGDLDIFCINVEALNTERGMLKCIRFLENHKTITIIDESTCIKSPKADRTKRCYTLAKLSKYRRIMTGTPITQSPLDLFSQFQFLKLGCLKFTSFTAFRAYYANMVTMQFGNRSFPKIVGFRNLDQLQKDISPHSYRKLKTECLDLPDKIYQDWHIDMTPEQERIYTKFKEEALLLLGDETLSSTSALTTIMKLQQIACGHVRSDGGNPVDIPNNRIAALQEIISECADPKIIIWANFRRDIELITASLEGAVHYYGGTSDSERADALTRFATDPSCRFFVGTPGTGGKSLTLVQSSTTIYYSNGYKLEDRLQSEDRNHRIGQKNNVTIIDIVCLKTVDERIVKLLKAKKDLATMVLDSMRQLLTDDLVY